MTGVLTWLAVAVLGGLGAVLRSLVDAGVGRAGMRRVGDGDGSAGPRHRARRIPVGILVVNVTGSFAAGALSGAALGDTAALLAATAFVGAYSTFSTWMLDVVEAAAARLWAAAIANLVASLALGALAAAAGLALGRAL